MKNRKLFGVATIVALLLIGTTLFAGTGGSEVLPWYTEIADSLKGAWGKVIAVFFLGLMLIVFKSGSVMGGLFFLMIALSIGTIPDIVDSRYTGMMVVVNDATSVITLIAGI